MTYFPPRDGTSHAPTTSASFFKRTSFFERISPGIFWSFPFFNLFVGGNVLASPLNFLEHLFPVSASPRDSFVPPKKDCLKSKSLPEFRFDRLLWALSSVLSLSSFGYSLPVYWICGLVTDFPESPPRGGPLGMPIPLRARQLYRTVPSSPHWLYYFSCLLSLSSLGRLQRPPVATRRSIA